jgi:hypothetical protein
MDFLLQEERTVSSTCLPISPENNSLPSDYIKEESGVPWNPSTLPDTKVQKAINEEVHHNSTHLSTHTESNRDISKSKNCNYFPNGRVPFHSEARSERGYMGRKKCSIDGFRQTSQTMSEEPVFRYFHQRDDYEYNAYEAERCLHSESDRSGTHSSDHQPHSDRWESYKIPKAMQETSISQTVRNSKSRSVSLSRAETGSVQDNAEGRYDVRALPHSRSLGLTQMLERHTNHAIKLADNNSFTYQPRTQAATETQLEISKDLSCRPQNKFTHISEPYCITETSHAEFKYSLKVPKTESEVKREVSFCGESCVLNLSEHSDFKRSTRAKVVRLSSAATPSEGRICQ